MTRIPAREIGSIRLRDGVAEILVKTLWPGDVEEWVDYLDHCDEVQCITIDDKVLTYKELRHMRAQAALKKRAKELGVPYDGYSNNHSRLGRQD